MYCAGLLIPSHLYENTTNLPVILQGTAIFMHYSVASFIAHLFILRVNQALI